MVNGVIFLSLLMPLVQATSPAEPTTQPSEAAFLRTLRPGHPRLIIGDDDLARVRALLDTDAGARAVRDELRKAAEAILDEPPVVHKLIGPRLLQESRRCLVRVHILAMLHRLDGDPRYVKRAEKEMLAAAAFPDWNPKHFLDTAEMSNALGTGYDWLYESLPPETRRTIRTAIVEKGLKPGLVVYARPHGWHTATHNWNQVCNGGLAVGALAIADEEPAVAAQVLAKAAASIRLPTARLAPDGGWDEGPGYWNYAMSYTAYYLAAVRTALGTDFGLSTMPGMAETGLFFIHARGPSGLTFNYADASAHPANTPELFLFARLFDRPVYAWHQRKYRRGPYALDLLWYDTRGTDADGLGLPLDARFRNVDVAFLRSAWDDPNALFVGFKGGDNRANHSHLDLGTFVLDAMGQRWAIDLGADDYNMPGYFGGQRWTYYRLRTEGHNTLLIRGENQDPAARAPISAYESSPGRSFAVADLTRAYANHAKRVRRGVMMIDRRRVLIQDEIEADGPLDVEWMMHTEAEAVVKDNAVTLTLGGRRLHLRATGSVPGMWEVRPVRIDAPQRPIRNTRKVVLRVRVVPPSARLAVLFTPGDEDAVPDGFTALRPLDSWRAADSP